MATIKELAAGMLAVKLRRMLQGQSTRQTKARKSCFGCGCVGLTILVGVASLSLISAFDSSPADAQASIAPADVTASTKPIESLQVPPPTPMPAATSGPVATATPPIDPAKAAAKPIMGSTRDEIMVRFAGAERDTQFEINVDPQAVKFVLQTVTVIVYFNSSNTAEGVSYLSRSGYMGDPVTGQGSYVHQYFQTLYQMATGGAQVPYKANSSTQYPVEVRIGNTHAI